MVEHPMFKDEKVTMVINQKLKSSSFNMCCNLYCEILQSLQNWLTLQSKQLHAVQERSVRACAEGTRDKIL